MNRNGFDDNSEINENDFTIQELNDFEEELDQVRELAVKTLTYYKQIKQQKGSQRLALQLALNYQMQMLMTTNDQGGLMNDF